MPDVKVAENANGDVALGVEVEGVFVPIASVPAHRIGHVVERGNDLRAKAEAGDEIAKEVLEGDFQTDNKAKSKTKTEEGGS